MNIQKGAIIGDMRRTKATIGELEDDVKRLTKRLDDIRCEHDETVALVSIQCETLALQEEALQNWRDQIDVFFWVEAIKDAEASRKEYADGYEALLAEAIKDPKASRKEYADRFEALLAEAIKDAEASRKNTPIGMKHCWRSGTRLSPSTTRLSLRRSATSAVHQRRVTLRRRACLICIRLTNRYARLPRT